MKPFMRSVAASAATVVLSMGTLAQQNLKSAPAAAENKAAAGKTETPLERHLEAYLRHLYAFGRDVQLTISEPKETGIPGLLQTNVHYQKDANSQDAIVYISKDGKYLLQGQLADLGKDPLAEVREKIDPKNAPSMGPANAAITLVEYSDFECPVCRGLHDALRTLLPKYPQIRVIFKDFPIEQIHPWARTAALAGQCVYRQKPAAFWKIYDLIYDHQDVISPTNAWEKMNDYGAQAGVDGSAFKACLAGPEAAAAVNASRENGLALEVNSTPTVFVNGRRIVGVDPGTIEGYIQYELAQEKHPKTIERK